MFKINTSSVITPSSDFRGWYDIKVIVQIVDKADTHEYLLWYHNQSIKKEYLADMYASATLQAVAKYKDDLRNGFKE